LSDSSREKSELPVADKLKLLLDFSFRVAREKELRAILFKFMDLAKELVEADRCSIFLHDATKKDLWTVVAHEVGEIRVPEDKGIVGHVFKTGEALNISDTYCDTRFYPGVDEVTGYRTKNMVAIPLKRKSGETLGVLEVMNRRGDGAFSSEDIDLLFHVATYASATIENAVLQGQLNRTRQERLAAYSCLAQAIAHEIRNPMMAIGGLVQRLESTSGKGADASKIRAILAEVHRLDSVMGEVDEFVTLAHPAPADVFIDELIQEAVLEFAPEWQRIGLHPNLCVQPGHTQVLDAALFKKALSLIFREIIRRPPRHKEFTVGLNRWENDFELVLGDIQEGRNLSEPLAVELCGKPWRSSLFVLMAHKIILDLGGKLYLSPDSRPPLPMVIRLPYRPWTPPEGELF
jgi:GAF domain-containing protein